MTLNEFRIWLEGFATAVKGAPTAEQWQALLMKMGFDLGEALVSKTRERQRPRRTHGRDADQQGEHLRDGEPRRRLHGLRIELKPTAATAFRMDDEPRVAQHGDVAQDCPARCSDRVCEPGHRRAAVATKQPHDRILSAAYVHE